MTIFIFNYSFSLSKLSILSITAFKVVFYCKYSRGKMTLLDTMPLSD